MTPIKEEWCNVTFAVNQPEYIPLPAHKDENGKVTTCWKLTFKERVKALFVGKMYLEILTFNSPLQPVRLWL